MMCSEWQPIETAPNDGTKVLMFGRYPNHEEQIIFVGVYDSGGYTHGWAQAETYREMWVSHWMPIPPPQVDPS